MLSRPYVRAERARSHGPIDGSQGIARVEPDCEVKTLNGRGRSNREGVGHRKAKVDGPGIDRATLDVANPVDGAVLVQRVGMSLTSKCQT